MKDSQPGNCCVCGAAAVVHLTAVSEGTGGSSSSQLSYCLNHVPATTKLDPDAIRKRLVRAASLLKFIQENDRGPTVEEAVNLRLIDSPAGTPQFAAEWRDVWMASLGHFFFKNQRGPSVQEAVSLGLINSVSGTPQFAAEWEQFERVVEQLQRFHKP